jgi:hypothetical protein
MRFSSMAVSVLAQSVPLLAVGHLAGWKKREERSWLQSRHLLRDALFVEDHDKKGMLFEKRVGVGVRDKHDNDVLEKKHSGSARLVQDSASSKVAFDDREASVECNPRSKVSDSGIFSCGMDSHCVESEESEMGGLCVSSKQATSFNRALQQNVTCVEGPDAYGTTCECSEFNNTSGVGPFVCIGGFCVGTTCVIASSTTSIFYDGSYIIGRCYGLNTTVLGLESYCYSVNSDISSTECEITADGVVCNSCKLEQESCPAHSELSLGTVFDCTNTVMNIQGNTCNATVINLFLNMSMQPTAPPETGPPNASPNEMPSPATNSGSCHAATVPIVVSAVAAAWMAFFGT